MTCDTLKNVILETFKYCSSFEHPITADFIWHGGEPLLAGFDFYSEAVRLQKESSNGIKYNNAFQTNGTLINDAWINFIKDNKFQVSISLDGPKIINDKTRLNNKGKSTFENVMQKINLLRKKNISFGICAVLHQGAEGKGKELYDFFAKERLPFKIIPLNCSGGAKSHYDNIGLTPKQYADIWISLFDLWLVASDKNYINCQNFSHEMAAVISGVPVDCAGKPSCSKFTIATAPDGNVYPCATFSSDSKWCYGNINENSLDKLMSIDAANKLLSRKLDTSCQSCKWGHICHGGCPSRALSYFETIHKKDYFCSAMQKIYSHIEECLQNPNNSLKDWQNLLEN